MPLPNINNVDDNDVGWWWENQQKIGQGSVGNKSVHGSGIFNASKNTGIGKSILGDKMQNE